MRWKRVAAASLIGVGVLSGLSLAVLRALPVVSESDVEEATHHFRELSAERAAAACEGEAMEALDELVRGRRFSACLTSPREDLSDALSGNLSDDRRWRWNLDEREPNDDVPIALGWDGPLAMRPPPYPEASVPPEIREVLTDCRGLDAVVTQIASEEVLCSPRHVGQEVGDADYLPVMKLARAIRVLARERARRGDGGGAISLLLDGMRALQDLRRGNVNLIVAMVSTGGTSVLASEIQGLLGLELGLDDDEIDAIRGRLEALAEGEPHPLDVLTGELVYFVDQYMRPALEDPGWTPPGGRDPDAAPFDRELAEVSIVAYRRVLADLEAACPKDSEVADCLDALRSLAGAAPASPLPSELTTVFGDWIDREAIVATIHHDAIAMFPRFIGRLVGARAVTWGLRALVGFHARRREGGCPGVGGFAREDLVVPGLGNLTVFELVDDQQFELHAPTTLVAGAWSPTSLPLLLATCPGLPLEEAGTFEPTGRR